MSAKPSMENYYKVLGLDRGASDKEINAAYRAKALMYHPDKRSLPANSELAVSEADELFLRVKEAYQALQDPKTRAELDLRLIAEEERRARDAQMDARRRQLKDDLLFRERAAQGKSGSAQSVAAHRTSAKAGPEFQMDLTSPEAALVLKLKMPPGMTNLPASEIQSLLIASIGLPVARLEIGTRGRAVVEMNSTTDAYKLLRRMPIDWVSSADWFTGYPPPNITIVAKASVPSDPMLTNSASHNKSKKQEFYSLAFENAVLERLRKAQASKRV
jgi:hypothetical protein